MAQVCLNKSSLSKEQKNLKNYKHFLPTLDLKRRKLLAEKNKARHALAEIKKSSTKSEKDILNNFPMVAAKSIQLDGLLKIQELEIKNENIVGVNLPVLSEIKFKNTDYVYFNSPYWFEALINELKKLIELKINLQIAEQRIRLLDKALQVVTQRNNLFEKVLIPKSRDSIRTIQIFLADNERASIVRSKIAKKKRQIQ